MTFARSMAEAAAYQFIAIVGTVAIIFTSIGALLGYYAAWLLR